MNEYCSGFSSSVVAATDYDNMAGMVDYQLGRTDALLEGSGWELKGYNRNQPRGKTKPGTNRGSFAPSGSRGWPADFPSIKPMTSGAKLKAHPDYEGAKAGDTDAAFKVVRDVIKPDKVLELGRLYPNAKIVPIRAEEAAGRNKIPVQFALRIGKLTGLEIEFSIGQKNRVHHTGANAVERFISRAQFDGEVEAGRDYIIVDDFVTLGGTISELRQYIENKGGHVVAATTMAVGGNARIGSSSNLALQESTRIALHKYFSNNELHEFLKENGIYNGNINALTNSEGKWLLTFSGLDTLRIRVAHARNARESRTRRRTVSPGTRAIGEAETKAGVKSLAVSPVTDTLIHYGGGIKTHTASHLPLHSSIIAAIDYDNMAQMLDYQLGRADTLLEESGWELKGYHPNQPRGKSSVASNRGSFTSSGSWPSNFPSIKPMTNGEKLKNHPDYEAGKKGDFKAATRVVEDIANREKVAELGKLYPEARIVPVHALESAGVNQLPARFADYIAEQNNMDVVWDIVQTNKVHHTDADAASRFINRAQFDGPVEQGRDYIIADDFVTTGGTASELRQYIEHNGGRVVAVTSLAVAGGKYTGSSNNIALNEGTLVALKNKFGKDNLHDFLRENNAYNGNIAALTENEGRWLLRFSRLDSARNKITESRSEKKSDGRPGIYASTQSGASRAREEAEVKSLAVSPLPPHSSIIAAINYDNMAGMVDYQLGRTNALLENSGWELKGYHRNQPRGKSSVASNRGSFISRGGWPSDFPTIKPMTSGPALTSHPDHKAAKEGDIEAANNVVFDLADREKIAELGKLYPKAIIIPVHAHEQEGRNEIPAQFTKLIGELTGNETAFQIVQTNKVSHTKAPAWWRFIKRAKFTGEVEAGRDYIIADDYVTLGGTVSDLRRYIESQGGRVVAATALAVASSKQDGSSADLALRRESLIALEAKFTNNGLRELLKEYGIYEGNPKSLTENEAHWLLKFSSLENIRKRLVKGLQEGRLVDSQTRRNRVEQKALYLESDAEVDTLPHLATKLLYDPFTYEQAYGTETFQERRTQAHTSLTRQAGGDERSRQFDTRRDRGTQDGDARECQDWRATLSRMAGEGKGIGGTVNESLQAAKRYYTDWDFAEADSRTAGMGHDADRQRDNDFRKALSEKHSGQDERRHSSALGEKQETVRKEQGLLNDVTDTLIHYGGGIKKLAATPIPLRSSSTTAIDYDSMAQMLGYQLGRANALLEGSGWELKGYHPNQPRGKSSAASNRGSFTSSGSFRAVSPREFVKARNQSKRMSFLSDVSPDDLKEHRLYLAHGGKVGYALDKHGDLQNVFNNGGPKGAGGNAIIDAIKNGATTLDCFSGYLSTFYARYGFVPTGYMKFNDEFAPKDWDYEHNERPDIMFMAYQGGDRATIEDRVGTFNEPLQTAKRYYTDWDSAKADSRAAAMGHDTDGQRDHDHRKALTGKSSQRHNEEHSGPLGRPQGRVRIRQELLSDVTDTLIHYGGSIKTLEESGDCWRFGGWLVVFGSHDASRFKDKFTAQTDFDIENGERRGLYYNHGLDPAIKRTRLGDCRVFVKEAGVWIEGQIRKRTDALKSHAEKIAANIESFGLSSGAPAHLVERKAVPGGHEILLWPLAEASITPTPAEPLTGCFSLKALVEAGDWGLEAGVDTLGRCQSPASSLQPHFTFLDCGSSGLRDGLAFDDHCAQVLAAVGELEERVDGLAQMRCVKSGRRWSAGKFETLGGLADGLFEAAKRIEHLAQEHAPRGDESEMLQALARFEAIKARGLGVR